MQVTQKTLRVIKLHGFTSKKMVILILTACCFCIKLIIVWNVTHFVSIK